MPRQYSHGGRVAPGQRGGPGAGPGAGMTVDGRAPRSLCQRFSALGNLGPFLRLIWSIHPGMTAATLLLRLVRAVLPVATLYIGKLIIDEVVRLGQLPELPVDLSAWLASGLAGADAPGAAAPRAGAGDPLGPARSPGIAVRESLLAMEQFFVEYRAAKVP